MFAWELLTFIGTVAFAMSGSMSAMEEEYDILGVYALGLVTAFGGGILRNLVIDAPTRSLWEQGDLLVTALVASSAVYFAPRLWANHVQKWVFFDAVGLAAFAIQGALLAVRNGLPLPAVIIAALLTGCGGGVIRDILARRKPLVFREEVYGAWAMLGGLVVALGFGGDGWHSYVLFAGLLALRMWSVKKGWQLPKRSFRSGAISSLAEREAQQVAN